MGRGFFITVEGIDGCGKSTQLEMLAVALRERGFDVVATRQPGGTPVGQKIRSLIIDEHKSLSPMAELLLMVADRAQHVAEVIKPNLEAGRIVISDRYTDSSVAFQGYGRGIDIATVHELNSVATGGLVPDLTILFDLDLEQARARLDKRENVASALTGFDEEERDFHLRVHEGYLQIAEQNPSRVRRIEATGAVLEIHKEVLSLTLKELNATREN